MRIHFIAGDYWHPAAPYDRVLKKVLEDIPHEMSAVYYPTPGSFDPAVLEKTDLLILCAEGTLPGTHHMKPSPRWRTEADEQAIADWVEQGGKLFAWHSGTASFDGDSPVANLMGGVFSGHPPVHDFAVRVTDPEHPLAAGVSDFDVEDELYRFPLKDPDNTELYMDAESKDHGVHPVALRRTHGKGEVFVYLLGHVNPTLNHPSGVAALRNILQRASA